MKRVLVTGGAGFIGSHTVAALLAGGVPVTVLDDFSSGKPARLPDHPDLRVLRGDIRDGAAVARAMAGASHVLHLAAQVSVTASVEDPPASASRNLTGFLNVLEGARRLGITRVVYASSAAVYGAPAKLPLDETSAVAPLSPYGLEKSINDQYAGLYASLYGLCCLGLRYFNVYGPRQDPHSPYAGVISIFAERAAAGEPLTVHGDGSQTRDFIYVGDVARSNLAALASKCCGVLNVATGSSVPLLQLIDTLGRCLGRVPQVRFAAPRQGDIRHSATRNDRLREWLGISQFTSLEAGLGQLVDDTAGIVESGKG